MAVLRPWLKGSVDCVMGSITTEIKTSIETIRPTYLFNIIFKGLWRVNAAKTTIFLLFYLLLLLISQYLIKIERHSNFDMYT